MARAPRIQFEDALYHVMTRGNRKEKIFLRTRDYVVFERFLFEAVERCSILLYDWCLMPNHLHLLVETPLADLSEFMGCLLGRYAAWFNAVHGLVGHVFQGRYKAILCQKDAYFLQLIRYIGLNPYKVPTLAVPGIKIWPWSGHRFYLGHEQAPPAVDRAIRQALELFGTSVEEARLNYMKFLADGLENGHWEDFYRPTAKTFLGNDSFIEAAKQKAGHPIREKPRSSVRLKNFDDLLTRAVSLFALSSEQLKSPSGERRLTRVRQALAYVGRRHYRFPSLQIQHAFQRSSAAVSMMVARAAKRSHVTAETTQLLDHLNTERALTLNTEGASVNTSRSIRSKSEVLTLAPPVVPIASDV
jgi:putative transposase